MRMGSRVECADFDAGAGLWHIQLEGGQTISTRFLLPALGFASKPYVPDIPGIEDFEGEWCHTARWPQEGIDLDGRKVAVIGTGASGVQVAQEAAKRAATLTLFQRTPIRSEEHTSELQSLMRISYAVFCLKKKNNH